MGTGNNIGMDLPTPDIVFFELTDVYEDIYFDTPTFKPLVKKKHKIRKRKSGKSWFRLRKRVMAKWHQKCADCGAKAEQAHHIMPVSLYPELQLVEGNIIALCGNCHQKRHKDMPKEMFNHSPTTPPTPPPREGSGLPGGN